MQKRAHSGGILWALLSAMLMTPSCTQGISRDLLKEVDQGIRFEKLQEEPENYLGKIVLLGGQIIKTRNFPDRTLIYAVQRPLDYRGEPKSEGMSEGRFIISAKDFLDPAIFREGRKVTVAGTVIGKEVESLGDTPYAYPVIEKKELHLWPIVGSADGGPSFRFGIGVGVHF